jgi:hypothetical protein
MPAPADARRRAARLTAQIAALGFVLPGTVASRYTPLRQARLPVHRRPPGPARGPT